MIAERLAAQLLSGPPATSPEAVVGRLLAVQAQDPRGARLSVRSRSTGLTAADVDAALSDRRSLLITWLNRGTLHLVTAEDYWWLHPLTTPQLVTGNARRLGQEGVSPAQAGRGVDVIAEAVAADGPQTRAALRARLSVAGIPTAGQALVHLLLAASLRGHVVRGPMLDGDHAYVRRRRLARRPAAPARRGRGARAPGARRYLAGHGPAGASDLAGWAGLRLGAARRGFAMISADLVDRGDGLADLAALADLADRPSPPRLPPPRLLGPFDPILHGWVSREPFVGMHQDVVTINGIFRPVALVAGRVVATWGLAAEAVTITTLEPVAPASIKALKDDAKAVRRFLGLSEARPTMVVPG